jgi:hypothetical protein
MHPRQFKKLWYAFGYVYPVLHPDGMVEKENGFGKSYDNVPFVDESIITKYPKLGSPYYVQSGCPVELESVVAEAWRRYNNRELSEEDFYCKRALMANIIENED